MGYLRAVFDLLAKTYAHVVWRNFNRQHFVLILILNAANVEMFIY